MNPRLIGSNIVAATDQSAEGRHAVVMARAIASREGRVWTVVSVVPHVAKGPVAAGTSVSSSEAGAPIPELGRLRTWLGPEILGGRDADPEVTLACGLPGIEICRLAAGRAADLIVLGRRARAPDHRLELGETSDDVVRRSEVPVLFVPTRVQQFKRVVAALDGTERARAVLTAAMGFAAAVGAELTALTVEPGSADEAAAGLGSPMPRARTIRFSDLNVAGTENTPVTIRRGNPIEEILAHLQSSNTDLLVIGYRRGGPPKVIGPTNIARNLLYAAPSAVLTVPI